MKYWTRDALRNKFEELRRRMERVSMEFQMNNPDEGAVDRLLINMNQDLDEILKLRRENGWPRD